MLNAKSNVMQEEQMNEGTAIVRNDDILLNHDSQVRNLVGKDVIVAPYDRGPDSCVCIKRNKKSSFFSPISVKFLTTMCERTSERFGITLVKEKPL